MPKLVGIKSTIFWPIIRFLIKNLLSDLVHYVVLSALTVIYLLLIKKTIKSPFEIVFFMRSHKIYIFIKMRGEEEVALTLLAEKKIYLILLCFSQNVFVFPLEISDLGVNKNDRQKLQFKTRIPRKQTVPPTKTEQKPFTFPRTQ